MWNGLLPVGSIVMLEGGNERLMIIGNCIVKEADHSKIFDYAGCLFPTGYKDADHIYMFNREKITRVYCVGYLDDEADGWLDKMEDNLKGLRDGTIKVDL